MENSNYIIDEADKTNEAIETVLSMLEEKGKEIETLTQQRDYYKERYNEFNKAFIKMKN